MLPSFTAEENENVKIEFFIEQGLTCFLSEEGNIHNRYVEDDQLLLIQEMVLTHSNLNINLGESVTVENIPDDTTVLIDGVSFGTVSDGELEFEPEEKGNYTLVLSNKPAYLDTTLELLVG